MIYLFEAELKEIKSVTLALKQVYGIGAAKSTLISKKLGFSKNLTIKKLSNNQIDRLLKLTDQLNLILASDLRKLKFLILKKLITIKSNRGLRRNLGLPIRGQRTHTNAKTARKIKI